MEPESSLPCSQKYATWPYSEPDISTPLHTLPFHLLKIHFDIIVHLRLNLPSGLYPSAHEPAIAAMRATNACPSLPGSEHAKNTE